MPKSIFALGITRPLRSLGVDFYRLTVSPSIISSSTKKKFFNVRHLEVFLPPSFAFRYVGTDDSLKQIEYSLLNFL